MKKPLKFDPGPSLGALLLLVFCFLGFGSPASVDAENSPPAAALGVFAADSRKDFWLATEVEGRVGRPLLIHLELSPDPPAAGTFYTAIVDVLESPDGAKPEIVPGVPDISVRCPKSGIYRLRIRANLIEKSSCALANAQILKEQVVRLVIRP